MSSAGGACVHCGLPARARRAPVQPKGPGPFCCTGCALVWHFGGRLEEGASDRLLARIVLCAFLAMGVMVFTLALYGGYLGGGDASELASEAAAALRGLYKMGALLLAAPIVHLLGLPLLETVARTRRWLSADALILAGSAAAFLVSVWNTLVADGPVYFETATMVLVLVGVGRWLDARAKERARAGLALLASDTVARAHLVEDGVESDVAPDALRVGDHVRVRSGETVPVDGVVLSGRAFLDVSALTGESQPAGAGAGDRVLAGSTALDGALLVRADAVGGGRVLAEIERLLAGALSRQGSYVRTADRVAAVLLPAALALAAFTAVSHGRSSGLETGLMDGLAVLLIACPCALGIATPLAFWSALGAAYRRGILVRGADVLERLARAQRVFLDKTGTLTDGSARVIGVDARPEFGAEFALTLAAALEVASEHPIGRSLVHAWLERHSDHTVADLPIVDDFRVLAGIGVEGRIHGRAFRLGRRRGNASHEGANTAVVLERDGEEVAELRLRAEVREGTKAAIDRLRELGLAPAILTGDASGPARDVGERLGVPVDHDLFPQDKMRRVEAAGRSGTIYVGDGLNDAGALAASDVGVVVAGASPRSVEIADVHLLHAGINDLPDLVVLARAAVRTARRNLAWAFSYNGVGLWLAATGRLTPILDALLMVLSSVAVVLSSLHGARAGGRREMRRILRIPTHFGPPHAYASRHTLLSEYEPTPPQ